MHTTTILFLAGVLAGAGCYTVTMRAVTGAVAPPAVLVVDLGAWAQAAEAPPAPRLTGSVSR